MLVAGVDEAGRGPLAGPVFAAAVVLDPAQPISGLADSKVLSQSQRERLAVNIKRWALAWALGRGEVDDIDRLNILQATLLAMERAVTGLWLKTDLVLIDGNRAPMLRCAVQTIVRGDALIAEIAAASILAKVARDAEMCALDLRFPGYGFARHKGYATRRHLQALKHYGVSPVHRRSFAPIKRLLP